MEFILYNAEKKLVQLLLKKYEGIANEIDTQIEVEIRNDYLKT